MRIDSGLPRTGWIAFLLVAGAALGCASSNRGPSAEPPGEPLVEPVGGGPPGPGDSQVNGGPGNAVTDRPPSNVVTDGGPAHEGVAKEASPPDALPADRPVARDARPAVEGPPSSASDAAPGTVLFADRFAAGELTGLDPLWGTWSICPFQGRSVLCQDGTDDAVSFVGDLGWTDYEVEVTAALPDDAYPGYLMIPFRAGADPTRFWALHVGRPAAGKGGIEWEIWVPVSRGSPNNGHTAGGGFSYQKGVPFSIRLRVQGDTVTVMVPNASGALKTYPVTKKYPAAGRVGIGSKGQGIRVLSFRVTKI